MTEITQVKSRTPNHLIITSLFIPSLLIGIVTQSILMVLPYLLKVNTLLLPPSNVISFLFNPILFLIIMYRTGKSIDIAALYPSVCFSLFVGGLAGGAIPYFVIPALFGAQFQSELLTLSSVSTAVVSSFVIMAEFGLSTLFSGFFAISLANHSTKRRTPVRTRNS
jgi:hypothetical protein